MKFKEYWGRQFGKPTGIGGEISTFLMNNMNKAMYKAIAHNIIQDINVLDIGFGNGYMLKKLLKRSNSSFYGVDISEDMVKVATRKNKKAIKEGRLKLACASAGNIPFENKFGQIYTINTVYFWDDLKRDLKEMYGKLDVGGVFINACYTKKWFSQKSNFTKHYKKHDEEELKKATEDVGFKAEIIPIKLGKSFYIKAVK